MPAILFAALLAQSALQVHGWVDAYYGLNANRPPDGDSFLPGTGTTAHRANELDVNAAAIDLSVEPKPVGMHLTVAFGSGVEVLHAAEPALWRNLYQASVSYAVSKLTVEAGIYPSHIGYESFFSKDNWNYTRGWMGEYSPYYQAGVKATYAFDARWSAQVHFLNGWQLIRDNNHAKAVGTQVAFAGEKLSVAFNTFAGPELPGDDTHWRLFGDVTAQYKVSSSLSLGASADLGWQDRPQPQGAALWHAASLFARLAFSDRAALALRAEYYDDRDGFMSGTAQLLRDGTLTLELRPAEPLILKLEAREDISDASVFKTRDGTSTTQFLALASAVVGF